jgi:hypothetical protein
MPPDEPRSLYQEVLAGSVNEDRYLMLFRSHTLAKKNALLRPRSSFLAIDLLPPPRNAVICPWLIDALTNALVTGKVDFMEIVDQEVSSITLNVGFVHEIFKEAESDAGI